MKKIIIASCAVLVSCAGLFLLPHFQDDRSYFVLPDKNAWPGDALSEVQVNSAFSHFEDKQVCSHFKPWRWALIGPGDYLLIGTHYQVVRRADAEIPNVGIVHGYWGGITLGDASYRLTWAKSQAEDRASDDCRSGIAP